MPKLVAKKGATGGRTARNRNHCRCRAGPQSLAIVSLPEPWGPHDFFGRERSDADFGSVRL
jgi:hypothetical protein